MVSVEIRRRTNRLAVRSPDIDGFLSNEDVKVLYERWDSEKWGSPILLHGSVASITCQMVRDVGWNDLSKRYGVRRAKRLLEATRRSPV